MYTNPFSTNELVSPIIIKDGMSISSHGEVVVYSFPNGGLEPDIDCGLDVKLTVDMELFETDSKYVVLDMEGEWGAEFPKSCSELTEEKE